MASSHRYNLHIKTLSVAPWHGWVGVVNLGNTPNTDILVSGSEGTQFVGILVRLETLDGSSQGIGAALAGSMANKSSIVIDLRGWRTPSVSGEELQALGKSGPRYTAEIARGLPVPRG